MAVDPRPSASNSEGRSPAGPALAAGVAAAAGVVAAAFALAAGEAAAALLPGAPAPLAAVGAAVIDLAPPGTKEVVVGLFGTADKLVLTAAVAGTVLLAGAAIGWLSVRRPGAAAPAVAGLVAIGVLAALRLPSASPVPVWLSGILQAAVGLAVLRRLRPERAGDGGSHPSAPAALPGSDRRRLLTAGGLAILALVGGGLSRLLQEGRAARPPLASVRIPPPVDPAPSIPPDASLDVPGLTPLIVPNDAFYRIDTALVTPSVDPATWRLRVHGMVDREVTLSFEELVELPLVERYVTIACVSNEVGGDLVGNARWTGVRLTDLLDLAGVQPGATQLVPRSVDGWTAGFPTAWVTQPERPRDALVAVRMNGEPLPAAHGFPARLIVPGLFGYVSATKWLSEIELTTMEAFDAYWVRRGWAKEAPVLTQSRIDVPRQGATLSAGPVVVAGVAWAPDRGISRVEVAVGGGPWQDARLTTPLAPAAWVQWSWTWNAPPGEHFLAVRATDGTGEVQTDRVTRPDPDGARGLHRIGVRVL